MELTADMRSELLSMVNDSDVPANVATRARIVLWFADGLGKKDVAERAGVSLPTVYLWLSRYESDGVDGLVDRQRGAPR
ncbi:helix-turn-helix domain-containing protein, partial [Pseudofrankia sp. BMG5.36]|uniref:helix-turn-helix domain-containing protein n=2 Tax=unclassified Pseudofrankia TaxID=2994372 RepID=UPI0010424CE9